MMIDADAGLGLVLCHFSYSWPGWLELAAIISLNSLARLATQLETYALDKAWKAITASCQHSVIFYNSARPGSVVVVLIFN